MGDATYPDDRRYHEAHDWVLVDGDLATFGITWHAQQQLGDIVYYAPPEPGATVRAGDSYGELESVKAVSDVIAPVDGEVVDVNEGIVSSPEQVNDDPYAAWLIRVRLTSPEQLEGLLDAASYEASL